MHMFELFALSLGNYNSENLNEDLNIPSTILNFAENEGSESFLLMFCFRIVAVKLCEFNF